MCTDNSSFGPNFDYASFPAPTRNELLVAAAKAGNQQAFVKLCEHCSPMLYRAIYRIVKNPTDTEDVLQDCFLRAYRGLNNFDQRASFSTWITRIGINSALMMLRKHKQSREESMTFQWNERDEWFEWEGPDEASGPEELCVKADLVLNVHRAIERLPVSLRCVIELHHTSGATVREISDTLNLSVPAVKARLTRARAALRRLLKEQLLPHKPNPWGQSQCQSQQARTRLS